LSTAGATYNLGADVSSTGTCFNVTAANVTLDCNNNWITYSTAGEASTRGIYTTQFNTTVKNCAIQNFSEAIRFYGAVQNAFTITSYSGFDPETSTNGNSNGSPSVDRNSVPQARTILFGVNVGF
jgi:hypothetical protein